MTKRFVIFLGTQETHVCPYRSIFPLRRSVENERRKRVIEHDTFDPRDEKVVFEHLNTILGSLPVTARQIEFVLDDSLCQWLLFDNVPKLLTTKELENWLRYGFSKRLGQDFSGWAITYRVRWFCRTIVAASLPHTLLDGINRACKVGLKHVASVTPATTHAFRLRLTNRNALLVVTSNESWLALRLEAGKVMALSQRRVGAMEIDLRSGPQSWAAKVLTLPSDTHAVDVVRIQVLETLTD
jgi:hypothetical protein